MSGYMSGLIAILGINVIFAYGIYVTAAAGGALVGLLAALVLPVSLALIIAGGVCFLLRAGSIAFGWHLPTYRSRPPR